MEKNLRKIIAQQQQGLVLLGFFGFSSDGVCDRGGGDDVVGFGR